MDDESGGGIRRPLTGKKGRGVVLGSSGLAWVGGEALGFLAELVGWLEKRGGGGGRGSSKRRRRAPLGRVREREQRRGRSEGEREGF